ncbi:MAG: hypothetical protein ACOYM2_00670 [Rectinemataceae bacterium]
MTCTQFMERFDSLEPGIAPTFFMSRHLHQCDSCRASVARVDSALAAWRGAECAARLSQPFADRSEERIMAAIRLTPRPRRELSMAQWLLPVVIVAGSSILLPLALTGSPLASVSDGALTFSLAMILGVGLAIFGSLFIISQAEGILPWVDEHSEEWGIDNFLHGSH